jgi:hypothetical protein
LKPQTRNWLAELIFTALGVQYDSKSRSEAQLCI